MGRDDREVRYTVPVNRELDAKVRRRIESGGFSTVAEYVRGLMRADVEQAAQRRLDELVMDRLEGDPTLGLPRAALERIASQPRPKGSSLDRTLRVLRTHEEELRRLGVLHAAVFGSTARGDASAESDVDIVVDLDPELSLGVFDFVRLSRRVMELVPGADVVERQALKPGIRARVEEEAVGAF